MFVHSAEYKKAVEDIAAEDGELLLAVAFWGRGAEALLAGRKGRPTRAICNLKSGATNPETVEALRKIKGLKLKQHDTLHAKAIASEKTGLVGSANFSANGLNLEGEEQTGWDEAGLLTTDPSEVESIRGWLERLWKKARPISDEDIEAAKALWQKRRASRPRRPEANEAGFSLCNIERSDLVDRPAYLVVYRTWLSAEAKGAYWAYQEDLTRQPKTTRSKLPPMYERWPGLPKKAQLIDMYRGKGGGLSCWGVRRRTHDVHFMYGDGTKGLLAICEKEDNLLGQPFGRQERKELSVLLMPHIQEIWDHDSAVGSETEIYIPLVDVFDIVCGG